MNGRRCLNFAKSEDHLKYDGAAYRIQAQKKMGADVPGTPQYRTHRYRQERQDMG